MSWSFAPAFLVLLFLVACTREADAPADDVPPARVESAPFGTLDDGREVTVYTLRNTNGMEVRAVDYGGIILSILVPDRDGRFEDVTLGFDNLGGYLDGHPFFGALVGRYGNRIGGARFELDGETYTLAANNNGNHLHGGLEGFDKKLWAAEPFENADDVGIVFSYTSPGGEEGYPGTLTTRITYTLTNDDELAFDYFAETDQATPVNLTQHAYFNLAGHDAGDVLGHVVTINADRFTPVDEGLIPTGELRPVEGTPFDFREPTPIGARIDDTTNVQIAYGGGYDHNFVLNGGGGPDPDFAVRVYEPTSGRVMEVYTTEPGVQFYTGNFLDGSLTGKGGAVYGRRNGFCLETQHFPDSPNKPDFPSTILRPGETYTTRTVYRFSTRAD